MIRSTDDIEVMCRYEVIVDGKVAGFAQISNTPGEGQPTDTRYVTIVKVKRQYRRRGLATRLYQAIEEHLKLWGLRLVRSEFPSEDALAFWNYYERRRSPPQN